MLPARLRRSRVRHRLHEQVDFLVIRNVENLRWETIQSLDRTFFQFGTALDDRFAATLTATYGAVRAALAERDRHADAVVTQRRQLEVQEAELSGLRDQIALTAGAMRQAYAAGPGGDRAQAGPHPSIAAG